MWTFLHLWQYLAQFFLEWELFQVEVVKKIKDTHLTFSNFFHTIVPFMSNVETYGTTGQDKDDNRIQHMILVCWKNNATDRHTLWIFT